MVSDNWDSPWRFGEMSLFGVCLFFLKKNRSSSSRRPERHANTKEVDISTKRVRTGGQGPIVMSWFQALSEQKGAEKSSSPESCQHSRQRMTRWAFFLRTKNIPFEETFENSVDTRCFSQLRMLEDQYLLSLLVLPRKFLWTDHFFLEMEDA